jgi:hypothetical protein
MKSTRHALTIIAVFTLLSFLYTLSPVFSAQTLQIGTPAPQNSIATPTLKNAPSPVKTIEKISRKNFLVIRKLYIKPGKPHAGDTITIHAKVANTGPAAIHNFKVNFYLNSSVISRLKGSLKSKSTKTFQAQVKPKAGSFTVKAVIPPGKITGRQFYTGNTAKLSLTVGPPVISTSRKPSDSVLASPRHTALLPSGGDKPASSGKIFNVSVKTRKQAGTAKKIYPQGTSILDIRWSRKGTIPTRVDILLYPFRQAQKTLYLRRGAFNNGHFTASAPGGIKPEHKYIVRVQTQDGKIYGDSRAFYPAPAASAKTAFVKPAANSVQASKATLKNPANPDKHKMPMGQTPAKAASKGAIPSHNTFSRPAITVRPQKNGTLNQKAMLSKDGAANLPNLAQRPKDKYPKGIWGGLKPLITQFKANISTALPYGKYKPVKLQYEFNSAEKAALYTIPPDRTQGYFQELNPGKPGKSVSGTIKAQIFPSKKIRYILRCENRNGFEEKTLTIRYSPYPLKILEFRPDKRIINRGESVRFFYKVKNPLRINIWNRDDPNDPLAGPWKCYHTYHDPKIVSQTTKKVTLQKPGNYSFELQAWGYGQVTITAKKTPLSYKAVTVVTVLDKKEPKILQFEVKPSPWAGPALTRPEFLYSFTNATSAAIYNYDTGKKLPVKIIMDYNRGNYRPTGSSMFSGTHQKKSGNTLVVNGRILLSPMPYKTTRYLLKVKNGSGKSASKLFKLEVTGTDYPIIHTFRVNPKKVKYNETARLEYDFENANKARIINYTDKKNRIVFDFRNMRYKGTMLRSLNGKRKTGKYPIGHVKRTDVYVLELENENGKVRKSLQLTVTGFPLAGYDFRVKRNTFLGVPQGDVKVEYELANLEYARIQHLDVRKNKYITLKNFSMKKNTKGSFTHKPSNGYFPARYRLIFKDPKFLNEQKMNVVVK